MKLPLPVALGVIAAPACAGNRRDLVRCAAMLTLTAVTACGGTLKTGTTKRPVTKPAADGTCSDGRDLCGAGDFAWCADLQSDPQHCGACAVACTPGIACQAGVCQQKACQGPVELSAELSMMDPTGGSPFDGQALLADINGDGRLDLVDWRGVAILDDSDTFHVALGQPTGGFGAAQPYDAGSSIERILAGDVNDDGCADLFVIPWPPFAQRWLGHPDGRLTLVAPPVVNGRADAIAIGDLSGDGRADLVSGQGEDSIEVSLSDSTGALHLAHTYPATDQIEQILIRDWDQDGYPDLVLVMSSLQLLHGRGDGTFDEAVDCGIGLPISIDPSVVVADFNGDGYQDLAFGGGWEIGVMLGMGGCRFAPMVRYEILGGAQMLRAADMNGNGQPDLVAIGSGTALDILVGNPDAGREMSAALTLLLGQPDGSFVIQAPPTPLGSAIVSGMAVAELTGDGQPDVLIVGIDRQVRIAESDCP